jgi:hypothetical protein
LSWRVAILALLHGASSSEVRHLLAAGIDPAARAIRLVKRPQPVPLDPASWQVLQRCLACRDVVDPAPSQVAAVLPPR